VPAPWRGEGTIRASQRALCRRGPAWSSVLPVPRSPQGVGGVVILHAGSSSYRFAFFACKSGVQNATQASRSRAARSRGLPVHVHFMSANGAHTTRAPVVAARGVQGKRRRGPSGPTGNAYSCPWPMGFQRESWCLPSVVVQDAKVLVQGAGAANAPAASPDGARLVDGSIRLRCGAAMASLGRGEISLVGMQRRNVALSPKRVRCLRRLISSLGKAVHQGRERLGMPWGCQRGMGNPPARWAFLQTHTLSSTLTLFLEYHEDYRVVIFTRETKYISITFQCKHFSS